MKIKDIKLLLNNHPYWKKLSDKTIVLIKAYQLLIDNPKEDLNGDVDNCPKQFFEPFKFFNYKQIDNQLKDYLYELDEDSRKVIYQIAQQKIADWRNSRNDPHYKIATYKEDNIFSKIIYQVSQRLSIRAFIPEELFSGIFSIAQDLSLGVISPIKFDFKSIAQRLKLSIFDFIRERKVSISQRLSLVSENISEISGPVSTFSSKIFVIPLFISCRLSYRTMITENIYSSKYYSTSQRLYIYKIAT